MHHKIEMKGLIAQQKINQQLKIYSCNFSVKWYLISGFINLMSLDLDKARHLKMAPWNVLDSPTNRLINKTINAKIGC